MKTPQEEMKQILKDYGSVIVDNALKILDNPDYRYEKSHDKAVAEALKRLSQIMEEANRPGREIWVAHNTGTTLENDVENMSFYNSRHEAVKVWGDRQLITKASLKQGQDS